MIQFVYKLVPLAAAPPDPLPEALPLSDLDKNSGFIHLSSATQVGGTLAHFFKDDDYVYILRVKYEIIESKVRWESPDASVCGQREGEGMFPHLYDGKLGQEEIDSVTKLEQVDGNWDGGLEHIKDWLV